MTVDYTMTLYKLFLGDQDSTTGHPDRGYTIHSITCYVYPQGGSFNFGVMGYHSTYGAVGFTEYEVDIGDVILDSFGRYYQIRSEPKEWVNGDVFCFYELDLERLTDFPFLSGFFGFEDEDHGTLGYGFEDGGFERGHWAL